MKYKPSIEVSEELAKAGLHHVKHEVELDEVEFNTWLERFKVWHPTETAEQIYHRVGYFLTWKHHGDPHTAKANIHQLMEQKFEGVTKTGKRFIIALVLIVIWLLILTVRSFAQVDCLKLQQNGSTIGNVCAPATINFGGSTCSVTQSGTTFTVNCSTGSITNNPSGSNFLLQTYNNGAFGNVPEVGLGKVLIDQGPGVAPAFADPLVQGTQADGSTTAVNPVAIGGYDTAGTPVLHLAKFLNSNPAGTEYGLVTRNIPSGTQAVSGTFWQTTQPVSGTFWQATQPVSGTFWQATQPVSTADGAQVTLGSKVDAKSTATDTTAVTIMQVLKEISAMAQAPASTPVTGTFWQTTQPVSWSGQTVTATQATGSNLHVVVDTAPTTAVTQSGTWSTRTQDGSGNAITSTSSHLDVNIASAVDPCTAGTKVPKPFSITANTQLVAGSAAKNVYICSIDIVAGAATNVALVESATSGNACATSPTGMAGGATAATGWNFAANGGLTMGSGTGTVLQTATSGDAVCLLVSAANQVSGSIMEVQQ